MADKFRQAEQALRRLPLPYSLALRLRDAGVAADVICQYVNVERAVLDGVYRIAEAKFVAALKKTELARVQVDKSVVPSRNRARLPWRAAERVSLNAKEDSLVSRRGRSHREEKRMLKNRSSPRRRGSPEWHERTHHPTRGTVSKLTMGPPLHG